jgi:flavin-binding protein dodecin
MATGENKVYSKTEIVGTSSVSFEDAVNKAIERAHETLRNLRWFEVTEQRGAIYEGQLEFQVTIEVGIELEEGESP